MTTQVQLRRGTTAQNDAFTGAQGEVTVDITLNQLRVHDGSTPGGTVVGAGTDATVPTNLTNYQVLYKDVAQTGSWGNNGSIRLTSLDGSGAPANSMSLSLSNTVLFNNSASFGGGLSLGGGFPGGGGFTSGLVFDGNTSMLDVKAYGGIQFGTGPDENAPYYSFSIDSTAVSIPTAGVQLKSKEGTNSLSGVATLVGGTVTVNNVNITASSRIFLTGQNSSGTPGDLYVSARSNGVSFTITSTSGSDTRQVAYFIVEGF